MLIFKDYEKILTKKIVCLDKNFISEKYRIQKILYKFENDNLDKLLIQTPYIYNRYSPSFFEGNLENKIHLDLILETTESKNINENMKQIIDFYKLIDKIQKTIKIRIRKKNLEKLKFSCSIKEKKNLFVDDKKYYNFRTKIHSMNGKPYLRVFNSEKNSEEKIKPNTFIRYIIHLESIWFFEDTYGFNWYIVQAEIKLPDILKEYSFDGSKNNIYDKYLKMLDKRIPEQAVKNKMVLDGLDPNLLYTLKRPNIPLPPPPQFSNFSLLKKVDKEIEKMVPKNNISVPTTSQLLDQLKKLKKVEKND
jgi:hypothetical protein